MKRSIKFGREATNINKVIVNQIPGAYKLETTMQVLASPNNSVSSNLNKSTFILASTDQSITRRIVQNNNNILPYLTKQAQSNNVVFSKTSLGLRIGPLAKKVSSKTPKKAYVRTITIQKNDISNLTIFAGVVTSRQRRKGEIYSLSSMDTLVVLQAGAPLENNILLFEDESKQKIWAGAAFQNSLGRWYKKISGPLTKNSRLYVKVVPNTKVIYQSELNESLFKTITNTFSNLYNINKGINSKQAIVNKLKTQTRNYFSSLSYAKNSNGEVPISFSFNRLDFFRNNGAFSKLIKNESEMMNSFELLSTKISRKRILRNNPTNRLTGHGPAKPFDGREYPLRGNLSYHNLFPTQDVLMVMSKDTEMKNITDGIYSYGVEFTFLDNTHEKLLNVLNEPTVGLKIVAKKVQDLFEGMQRSGNYDVYTQSLSDAYIKKYEFDNKQTIITGAISSYISAISLFHKDLAKAIKLTPNSLATKLFILADPLVNGPSGPLNLLNLVLDLAKQINLKIKMSSPVPAGAAAVLQMQSSKLGSGSRLIKIKHYFDEFVDTNDLGASGFDYLSPYSETGIPVLFSPFKQLTYQQVQDLRTNEIEKYDNLAVGGVLSLTPNYFSISGKSYKINSNDPNQEETNSIVATSLLAANKFRNSPLDFNQFNVNDDTTGNATGLLSIIKNNLKVIEKENCSISINLHDDDTGIFRSLPSPVYPTNGRDYLDAAEKMSEPSPFVINKTGSVSVMNFILNSTNNISQEGYYSQIKQLNNGLLSYLVQTDYFVDSQQMHVGEVKNITDQQVFSSNNVNIQTFNLRALEIQRNNLNSAASTMNSVLLNQQPVEQVLSQELSYAQYISTPVSASDITSTALKYGNIKKIQYLAGYRKLNDSVIMKDPIWLDLTETSLNNFSETGKTLLCRMAESYTEFARYKGIKSSLYDETFLVSPSYAATAENTVGDSAFSLLPESNFTFLNNMTDTDSSDLNYSMGALDGTRMNVIPAESAIFDVAQNKQNNLYTSGGDFLLPNGEAYIGDYHLRYQQNTGKYVAMVGKIHSDMPHDVLKAISDQAQLQLIHGDGTQQQRPGTTTTGGSGGTAEY